MQIRLFRITRLFINPLTVTHLELCRGVLFHNGEENYDMTYLQSFSTQCSQRI